MSEERQTQVARTSDQAVEPARQPLAIGTKGLELKSFDDLWRFSVAVSKSGMAPKDIKSPEAIMIAIQLGLELGLTPMAALQNIAVVNGRPTIWGDAALGLVRASGLLESYTQTMIGNGDGRKCVVTSKRRGMDPLVSEFSVADAKVAGLHGNGVHKTYPDRMLMFRARGFNLRDNFGDVLKGLHTAEEMSDLPSIEVESKATPTFTPQPEKPGRTEETKAQPAPEGGDRTPSAPAATPTERIYALLQSTDGVTEPEIMTVLKRKKLCKADANELAQLPDAVIEDIIASWSVLAAQVRIDKRAVADGKQGVLV